jgi:hypothetical protein
VQTGGGVTPVVGAVAARDNVERRVGARQTFSRALAGVEVAQRPTRRLGADHRDHRLRQIVGHHFAHEGRQQERDMAAAATEVEREGLGARADDGGELPEVLALRMDRAGEIGLRLRTELFGDERVVGTFLHVRRLLA